MTYLSGTPAWDEVVQHETDALVLGGPGGPMNEQAQSLVNRTEFLRQNGLFFDSLQELRTLSGTGLKRAFLTGAVQAGDGGGGMYRADPSDTTSPDNGGTVVVAASGLRFKMDTSAPVPIEVFKEKVTADGDWTPAFSAAIDAGVKIRSYRKDAVYAIKTPLIKTNVSVDVDLGGNTLLISVGNNSFRCVAFVANFTDIQAVTLVQNNQTVIGSRKGVAVTLADASAYEVGDHVRLFADDAINPNAASYERVGQSFEVLKKSGNVLYFGKNTELNFTTNIRIAKHNKAVKCRFGNAKVSHTSTSVGIVQVLVDICGHSEPEAYNVKFSNTAAMGLRFAATFRAKTPGEISGVDMKGNTAANEVGYVLVSSGTDGVFSRLSGTRVRHVYTSTAEDISANDANPANYGGAVNDIILHTIGEGCHSYAADTHSDAVSVRFERVVCYSNGQERGETCGALQFRGIGNKCVDLEHHGNNIAVFFNVGYDRCSVENVVSYGGQAFRATGITGYEVGQIDEITHYIEDDNIYGLQVSVGAEITIGEYKAIFRNKEIAVGTKQLMYLVGKADNTLTIDKMVVDVRQVAAGKLSSFVPVQFGSNWGTVRIREYQQYNGPNVTQSRGIGSFVQGSGTVPLTYQLFVEKAKFYTQAATASALNPSIKTGSLNAETAKIFINYELYGIGFKFDSSFKSLVVSVANKFIPHCFDLSVASALPYVNSLDDMELVLSSGSTSGSAVLQPPAYIGQCWRITIGGPRAIPLTINSVAGTVISPAPGTTVVLVADALDGWTQKA